jgi:hypothetical protein
MTAEDLFEKHTDEFLKFDRIPEAERRHPRPDLCAMLYLHERFGGDGRVLAHAEHDEVWLDFGEGDLSEADVVYLHRCGVRCNESGLCMFV